MPAFKPDSSFFRKVALGAVGARAIRDDLAPHGHDLIELERGSTDTKLWKDVKRKRVRIPDLVCVKCGVRIESRAKTKAEFKMSHSLAEAERAWDFGLVGDDWIAFPICDVIQEVPWTRGRLDDDVSYWHERNWVRWKCTGSINYLTVDALRRVPHDTTAQKGATEGSEVMISWAATFASCDGAIDEIAPKRIYIGQQHGGRRWVGVRAGHGVHVTTGSQVRLHQLLAGPIPPLPPIQLQCPGHFSGQNHLEKLLSSSERTQRFTGVKLARVLGDMSVEARVAALATDPEEDLYVRLEGITYAASAGKGDVANLFAEYLASADDQVRLESVISIGEVGTTEAVAALERVLLHPDQPYFLRSAAAWSLGRIGTEEAQRCLVRAFMDMKVDIREQSLVALMDIGGPAVPVLVQGLRDANDDIAAGCAEVLRQVDELPESALTEIATQLHSGDSGRWAVWLAGNLPSDRIQSVVAGLQESKPQLHYVITLLWCFTKSWIFRYWEAQRKSTLPEV